VAKSLDDAEHRSILNKVMAVDSNAFDPSRTGFDRSHIAVGSRASHNHFVDCDRCADLCVERQAMLDFDPRDHDHDVRDIEMPWIQLGHGQEPVREQDDSRECDDVRDRDRDGREREVDPRDVFLDGLELPRGLEREIVIDGHHQYELNGDDSRSLATVGPRVR
jgi:hypothetical protein